MGKYKNGYSRKRRRRAWTRLICLKKESDMWWDVVNMIMNLWVP